MTRKRASKKHVRVTAEALREKKYKASYTDAFKPKRKKQFWLAIALIGLFCLVLFFNSYFNYTSGVAHNPDGDTIGTRFYLSGPDPYYNMRTCEESMESGYYRFVTEEDPLLNYPEGHYGSARPPLFNMIAIASASVLENFMPRMDALGWSMLFLPAIYGALLIFPVYGIGKHLFNKKVGIISAMLVPLIPIHISSGHGSALSLFDHDSFLLLLFTITFYFMIRSLKEEKLTKSLCFAGLSGLFMGAIQMTWVSSYFVFILFMLFLTVFIIFDIFKGLKNPNVVYKVTTAVTVGFLVSLPYLIVKGGVFAYPFFVVVASWGLMVFYYLLRKLNWPWIITVPTICTIFGGFIGFLYMVHIGSLNIPAFSSLAGLLFGSGIYGSKVALTIGEAHTFPLSQTAMSFGPALLWIGLSGFILYLYNTYRTKWRPENLFFIIIFLVYFWLTSTAGRFLNDLIPVICILSGYMLWIMIKKLDYKQMVRDMKAIGGFRGIRKGMKLGHLFGILFICFLIIMPGAFLSLDAAVPPHMKAEVFGEGHSGAYGLGLGQSYIWTDACHWLSQQDTEIEDPADRPGWISWWDYGFYVASMGEHPTVADNYQRGIKAAGNFHTASSEKEAVAVLIIRIVQDNKTNGYGEKYHNLYPGGVLDENVKEVFKKYLGNESEKVVQYIEKPYTSSSCYTLIAPEYGNNVLTVTAVNAMYHDCCDIITKLSDKEITMLYHEMMETTGYSIRYYGIDQRDLTSIFGVFPFLSDKATQGFVTMEDDYFVTNYYDKITEKTYTEDELNNLSSEEVGEMDITTITQRKQAFFDTFIYRNYFGIRKENEDFPTDRIPTYLLKHFRIAYISPQITITKYYEGAIIKGQINFNATEYNETMAVALFDEYNIAHDVQYVMPNGLFELVSIPGNNTIKVLYNDSEINVTSVTVTEEEATWEVPFVKEIVIEVE